MDNENNKFKRFSEAVIRSANEVNKSIYDEIEKERERTLNEAENEALNESFKYVKSEVARIKTREGKRVSKHLLESKRMLFTRRNEISESVFKELKQKILDYTKTPEYKNKLIELATNASKAISGDKVVLYLRPLDLAFSSELSHVFEKSETEFREGSFELGGLIAECPSKHIRIDSTFDSALNEKCSKFTEMFGQSVFE